MTDNPLHIPVMADKIADMLIAKADGTYLDATCGMGGHVRKILERLSPGGKIIALDWDPESVKLAKEKFPSDEKRIIFAVGNYADAPQMLAENNISQIDGALMDLGFSSYQLSAGRGFSFLSNDPLDMRFSPETKLTAAEIVNTWPQEQIALILKEYGEEKFFGKIARGIVAQREKTSFTTASMLAAGIEKISPRRSKIHPATRTFQALRIAVNSELRNLSKGLSAISKIIAPSGRLAIITFHSLEDRLVKHYFRELAKNGGWKLANKKPLTADKNEISQNPRSRSAKLRVIERVCYE
ncbi:MAG: 16S rRNA (cytosine(1402)-N(4))-methyltransferase RsmH [Elusimicrobia bacterium]|nr:16S rRNA (cytosine(1402)-N(4))-methyltransferase RsmH [Elusimicrobiota bacterium]